MSRLVGPLTGDAWLLFVTRFIRLFAYGALSVVLVLYLVAIGIDEANVGLLLTATLIGDTVVSLALSSRADRVGRRRVLILGALLMAAAGLVFASTHLWWLLLLAGIVGIISPSGHEVGPFLPIEQAALAQVVDDGRRKLSALFALDSFGGGFVVQGFTAYWFHVRFGFDPGALGCCSSLPTSWPAVPHRCGPNARGGRQSDLRRRTPRPV